MASEPPPRRRTLARRVPVRFYVFDVLSVDGRDITRQAYASRRDHLTEIATVSTGCTVQFPSSFRDTDPATVLAASAELGLEGIVCKHLDSQYTPGLRSRDWIKTPHRLRSEFVVGGWLPGVGVDHIGAVLVGAYGFAGRLQFCGAVPAGAKCPSAASTYEPVSLLRRRTSPFSDPLPDFIFPPWPMGDTATDWCGRLPGTEWHSSAPVMEGSSN
uniref:ATP-dependent DNA ligase-like protein n=1 Tax=Mycobacterium sp. (strain KMS) TaxID=189918 RepID=A1UB61_MYCSK